MLLMEEQVMEWTGYQRRGDLQRWLTDNQVPFLVGKGGRVCVKQSDLESKEQAEGEFLFGQTT